MTVKNSSLLSGENIHTNEEAPEDYLLSDDPLLSYKVYHGELDFLNPNTFLSYYTNHGAVHREFSELLDTISEPRSVDINGDSQDIQAFLFPSDFTDAGIVSGAGLEIHPRDTRLSQLRSIYELTMRVYMQLVGTAYDYDAGGYTNAFREYVLSREESVADMDNGVLPENIVRRYVIRMISNGTAPVFTSGTEQTSLLSNVGCSRLNTDPADRYIDSAPGYLKSPCTLSEFKRNVFDLIIDPYPPATKTGDLLFYVYVLSRATGFIDLPKETSNEQRILGEIFVGDIGNRSLSRLWGLLPPNEAKRVYNEELINRVYYTIIDSINTIDS